MSYEFLTLLCPNSALLQEKIVKIAKRREKKCIFVQGLKEGSCRKLPVAEWLFKLAVHGRCHFVEN